MVTPIWLPLLVPFFWGLVLLFLYRALSRKVTLKYALCDACEGRSSNAALAIRGIAVASITLVIAIATAYFNGFPAVALAIVVAGSAGLALIHATLVQNQRVWVSRIRPDHVYMRGVHSDVAQAVVKAYLQTDGDA